MRGCKIYFFISVVKASKRTNTLVFFCPCSVQVAPVVLYHTSGCNCERTVHDTPSFGASVGLGGGSDLGFGLRGVSCTDAGVSPCRVGVSCWNARTQLDPDPCVEKTVFNAHVKSKRTELESSGTLMTLTSSDTDS